MHDCSLPGASKTSSSSHTSFAKPLGSLFPDPCQQWLSHSALFSPEERNTLKTFKTDQITQSLGKEYPVPILLGFRCEQRPQTTGPRSYMSATSSLLHSLVGIPKAPSVPVSSCPARKSCLILCPTIGFCRLEWPNQETIREPPPTDGHLIVSKICPCL